MLFCSASLNRREVVKLPRHQRPGLRRRLEEAAFDLLTALVKARYLKADTRAAAISQGSQALDTSFPVNYRRIQMRSLIGRLGTEQLRFFRFDGDRLQVISAWMPPATGSDRGMGKVIITWERAK